MLAVARRGAPRIFRVVHRIAYRIWLCLLAARLVLLIALLLLLLFDILASRAQALPPGDLRAQRQWTINHLLRDSSPESIARERSSCANGKQPNSIAQGRASGVIALPDAVEYCVTVLTRLGRDGALGFVRLAGSNQRTPALAFDQGFVSAYRKREPVSAALPAMATLKPVAEQCLAQQQSDTDLCFSAGYVYGVRAAQGEIVTIR